MNYDTDMSSLALSLAVGPMVGLRQSGDRPKSASETASERVEIVTKNPDTLNQIVLETPIKSGILSALKM
ncbi:MAG TPA: hypothetical protein PKA41_07755 [Verrucomicrobiota bacterium]|nr:hypothetical protein [Verrucomicrobiota bacterium]